MNQSEATGFEFPCSYQVKAMGLAEPDFDALVLSIVRRHCPEVHEGSLAQRASSGGKYVSVSLTVTVRSRESLDAMYEELTAHEKILARL